MTEGKIHFFLIFFIFLNLSQEIISQIQKNNKINISANYYRGYISDKQKRNFQVINQYINGFNLSLSKLPDGSKNWHSIYNFPETGYSIMYLGTGNPEILGHIIAASRYIDFHLYTKKRLDIACRTALGAAFTSKVFHPVENYKNIFFSKPVNFIFELNLSAEYNLFKKHNIFMSGGISLMHASNGETKLPNKGISTAALFVGISKKESFNQNEIKMLEKQDSRKLKISVLPTVGWKEYWRYGSKKYLELSFSGNVLYNLNKKQLIGTGFDIFYDETRMVYSTHNIEPVSTHMESVSGGFHVAHHLNLSPLFIVFKTGINIINRKIVKSNSYNLIGLKYNVIPNLFVCMYHKSHGAFYGDNLQWGLGFEF